MTKFLVFLLILIPLLARAEMPGDMKVLLEGLPGKKINFDLVLALAMRSSDSFRIIQSQRASLRVSEFQSLIPLESRITAGASLLRDEREPQSPFSPIKVHSNTVNLGYSSYFTTGTSVGLDLSHGSTDLGFSTFTPLSFYETKATLGLSQNLWQDAFGTATRLGSAAGKLFSEAAELGLQISVNDWVVELVQIYYGAWLAQAQLEAARASLQRRTRLLEITEIKARRGTAEEPDVLQIKSALLTSSVLRDQASQNLGERWRGLVVSLKLPAEWSSVDASLIPIALDSPVEEMLALCGPESTPHAGPDTSPLQKRAALSAEAAHLHLEKARSEAKPDLELRGTLSANGIDPAFGPSFSETSRAAHPAWSVGLQLAIPLGFYAEKTKIMAAAADEIRTEAQASQSSDLLKMNWINDCINLHRTQRAWDSHRKAFENQQRRVTLEESRFRIGRGTTIQVIQAGDDATTAQLDLNSAEVERRLAAWKIRRHADRIHLMLAMPAKPGEIK